jgi:hypothetical protein
MFARSKLNIAVLTALAGGVGLWCEVGRAVWRTVGASAA